ncbi:MAG TPA: ABC transporter substrate-binding protein [Acidimicrobiales bacterium]|nr:ABC transporter substrate-binding protein [Acidimicrobiales bacterium]
MRFPRWLVALLTLPLLLMVACGDDDDDPSAGGDGGDDTEESSGQAENTGSVNVLSAAEPEEADAYNAIFDELINADADYTAEVEASANFEEQLPIRAEGGTLDVAAVPQPGAVVDMAADGMLVSLEDLGFDIDELNETFGESFMALGEYEGEHYGLPSNINLKSMVWYPKDDFDAAGYTVPETWDDLIALSDQIVADGSTPWCVGFESGGATGWPATDWMEDIMLRTAGGDVYDQWVAHEIPFDDDAVVAAAERFGEIMFGEGYVLGGAENTPNIAFADSPLPMFDDPPKCWLHRQASFINSSFPGDSEAGVDYDWFPLPGIDQDGTLFAGELTVVGKNANRPEVKDFLDKFIGEEVQCEMGGVQASSRISPNVDVGPDCYANEILADASVVLTEALQDGSGRFDASDLMPTEVGAGSFWTGMMEYVQGGPDSLEGVLQEIEDSWPA